MIFGLFQVPYTHTILLILRRLNGLTLLSINKNDSITSDEFWIELPNKKGRF